MKALILSLLIGFSSQAYAMEKVNPAIMTSTQQAQLLNVLNQLDPEVLSDLLSDDGLDWYISQYNRMSDSELEIIEEAHSRIDLGVNPYEDPNAPRF